MIYTLDSIKRLVRSKDQRLESTRNFPDSWVEEKIEQAFEIAESLKQVFYITETYDLSEYVASDIYQTEIILNEEPHNIYGLEYDDSAFSVEITGNKHLDVKISSSAKTATNKNLVVSYFYYPTLPFTAIELSPEIYHYFTHCLYVVIYGALKDKENEMYHQSQVDRFVSSGSFELPYNFEKEMSSTFVNRGWL